MPKKNDILTINDFIIRMLSGPIGGVLLTSPPAPQFPE